MSNSSGRKSAQSRFSSRRSTGSSFSVVLVTALLGLLIAGMTVALSGIHPAEKVAATAAQVAAHAASRTAGGPPPLATSWLATHPQPALDVQGPADVLIDVDSKQVLWERDPHSARAPASLTKLITAMVAADLAPLDRKLTVTAATDVDAVRKVEPTSTVMGLTAGEALTVRELLYGLFLRSGNDAAETLAAGIVSRGRFIQLMNQKAASLHMADSHFTTPVGLDDPALRSSPYDLAIAASTIVTRYSAVLAIAGTPSIELGQTPTHKAFDLTSYNKLLLPGSGFTYQGATGMKTAYTDDAGMCMVATATRDGRRLAAVVMHSDVFFTDAVKLLDYGFSTPR